MAVAELIRRTYGAARDVDAEEVAVWLGNPELKPEWLRVLEIDGEIVGYGDIVVTDDAVIIDVAAPGHSEVFLQWAEDEARAARVPRTRVFFPAGHALADVVAARGYRYWRSSYTLEVELSADPPRSGTVPDGLTLRTYEEGDAEALRAGLNSVFVEDPFFEELSRGAFEAFYLGARAFDPTLWLLAWEGRELVGFVLAFPQRAGDTTLGWVESLGVERRWRRRGLGRALLQSAFAALHDRGLRRVGLGVDASNETGALRLYEGVGMRQIRRGDNWTLDIPLAPDPLNGE